MAGVGENLQREDESIVDEGKAPLMEAGYSTP